ncbi:MAG TPA: CBS domain-containing protein [Nodosilinea sp.]|nr:CBS domain-containing protein [Nodosilinea sp.]
MLTVADIMTHNVTTISSGATVADAIDLMQQRRIRSLLVEHRVQDMPFGMVNERDIVYTVVARGHDPEKVLVQDIMRQPCISLDPDLSVQEASQVLSDTGVQRAPVMQDGQLLGVISVTDILMRGMPAMVLSH